jgi:probable HAF family extracellular repeat protein
MINLTVTGGLQATSGPLALNNSGQITGSEAGYKSYYTQAILWTPSSPNGATGTTKGLGSLPGFETSIGQGINSQGDVVGYLFHEVNTETFLYHAFLYHAGAMIDLNNVLPSNSGWVLQEATGINDKGQIVGYGTNSGQVYGFLLTPVTGPVPPAAPANLAATPGSARVSLSWTTSASTVSYNVKRSGAPFGTYTTIASGVSNASYVDTTVHNQTDYYYEVSAVNAVGESQNSVFVHVLTAAAPNAPTHLKGTAGIFDGMSGIELTATASNSPNIATYNLYRMDPGGSFFLLQSLPAADFGNLVDMVDLSVTSGTKYTYAMTAVNTSGEESNYSNEVSVKAR